MIWQKVTKKINLFSSMLFENLSFHDFHDDDNWSWDFWRVMYISYDHFHVYNMLTRLNSDNNKNVCWNSDSYHLLPLKGLDETNDFPLNLCRYDKSQRGYYYKCYIQKIFDDDDDDDDLILETYYMVFETCHYMAFETCCYYMVFETCYYYMVSEACYYMVSEACYYMMIFETCYYLILEETFFFDAITVNFFFFFLTEPI